MFVGRHYELLNSEDVFTSVQIDAKIIAHLDSKLCWQQFILVVDIQSFHS